jgi:hypothetical protein
MGDDMTVEAISKRCFVIGPIGGEDSEHRIHADWLFTGIIKPIFDNHFPEFRVERADKIPTPGMVSGQIINRLYEVELVIADLSFHNANAFYEMAIRHNVGKPIIHMIRKAEPIPFDVIPHRAIPFSVVRASDLEDAKTLLLPAIAEAIAPGFEPDNPIMHARGQLRLRENASPEIKVLSDEIETVKSQLATLLQLGTPPFEPNGSNYVTEVSRWRWASDLQAKLTREAMDREKTISRESLKEAEEGLQNLLRKQINGDRT